MPGLPWPLLVWVDSGTCINPSQVCMCVCIGGQGVVDGMHGPGTPVRRPSPGPMLGPLGLSAPSSPFLLKDGGGVEWGRGLRKALGAQEEQMSLIPEQG